MKVLLKEKSILLKYRIKKELRPGRIRSEYNIKKINP
jgi:hypothetical protein